MTKSKIKIGVIGLKGLPAFGGAAAVGENIILNLKKEYDFTVYSTSSHTNDRTGLCNGYKQVVFNKIPFKKINTLYYYIISVVHALLKEDFDLIHFHHRDAAFLVPILKMKYKVVLTSHGSFFVRDKWKKYEWYFKLNEKYFVKYANLLTCVSLQEKREFESKLGLEVKYIPNGVSKKYISESKNLSLKPDPPYLFFGAGRIIKTKGLDILLKSIHKSNIKIPLLVAGDIDQTYTYKKEIISLSKNIDVKFLGLIKDKEELLEYIKNAKIFIFPSSFEAMSMMLLEAITTKCPIIASDIIQNRDILSPDEVLFFKTDNVDDLSDKIQWALMNYNSMKDKANKAYNRFIEEYTWENISSEYSNVFKKIS